MSLLYRAIWADRRADTTDFAAERLRSWVKFKTAGCLAVPEEGSTSASVYVPPRPPGIPEQRFEAEVKVVRVLGDGPVPDALTATLVEQREDGTRWDTTLRAWNESTDEGAVGWLWVDVECVGPVELNRIVIGAPRLAVDLIQHGVQPFRGVLRLSAAPVEVDDESSTADLVALIRNPDRDLPVVVFTRDQRRLDQMPATHTFEQIVQRAANQLAGVASAYVVSEQWCAKLTDELGGRDYGVWSGAFRTYLPGFNPEVSGNNLRHRYVLGDQYLGSRGLAARIVSRAIGPASGTRRPPESYTLARNLIRGGHVSDPALAELLQQENDDLISRNASLNEDLQRGDDQYVDLVIDLEDAVKETEGLSKELAEARRLIRAQQELMHHNGVEDTSWAAIEVDTEVPDSADSLRDAALKTQLYLSDRVVLPDAALRDLDDLDSTVEAGAWARTAWRGFRALYAYAADQANGLNSGSFWQWCKHSKHVSAWPATDKKLSMSESQSVETNASLRSARILPVSTDVSPDGCIYMPSHLKIATGGGNLAPRIYFHWDPAAAMVHVGFFGPHKYMPNTRT